MGVRVGMAMSEQELGHDGTLFIYCRLKIGGN